MQPVSSRSPRQWFAAKDLIWALAVITAVALTITVATGAPTSRTSEPAYSEGQPGLEVVASHRPRTVPSVPSRKSAIAFLMSLYDCWSVGKASNCPVELDVAPEAVDVVRTFSGTVVHADIENVTAVNFSISCKVEEHELLVNAEVRLFREPLSREEIEKLEARCDLSDIKLELLTKTDDDAATVVEDSIVTIAKENLGESQSIVFKNLARQYRHWIERNSTVSLSFGVGGLCRGLNLSELGFYDNSEALIIGYHNKQGRQSRMEKRFAHDLEISSRVRKREIGSGGLSLDYSVSDVSQRQCELYDYNVSFADLNWDDIIVHPESYCARICAGGCTYPFKSNEDTTVHSYIQGLFHHIDNNVPSPCCVPIRYGYLYVIQMGERDPVMETWMNTIALECGCR